MSLCLGLLTLFTNRDFWTLYLRHRMPPWSHKCDTWAFGLQLGGSQGTTFSHRPQPPPPCDQMLVRTSLKQRVPGRPEMTMELTVHHRQAQIEVGPWASALIIRAPSRDKNNIKHNGNITSDETVNTAQQMQPRSLTREFSGTVKEISGTAQSVGCNADGHRPRDNSGAVECSAS